MQDMFATVQQGNSPVRTRGEATASGDRWIEDVWSKGKAVNAPALPSHREFADILQQTYDNPYKSNRPEEKVGDAWLTSRGKGSVLHAPGELLCIAVGSTQAQLRQENIAGQLTACCQYEEALQFCLLKLPFA